MYDTELEFRNRGFRKKSTVNSTEDLFIRSIFSLPLRVSLQCVYRYNGLVLDDPVLQDYVQHSFLKMTGFYDAKELTKVQS